MANNVTKKALKSASVQWLEELYAELNRPKNGSIVSNPQLYKAIGMTRDTFSRFIKRCSSGKNYCINRNYVLAFGIVLQLTLPKMQHFLRCARCAQLSNRFYDDRIILDHIRKGDYDFPKIYEALCNEGYQIFDFYKPKNNIDNSKVQ